MTASLPNINKKGLNLLITNKDTSDLCNDDLDDHGNTEAQEDGSTDD